MINKNFIFHKSIVNFVLTGFIVSAFSSLASTVSAGNTIGTITLVNPLCLSGSGGTIPCINDFPALIKQISTYVSGAVGILATLMLVIAGIMFVISAGNPGKIETAKKIAIYAAVGMAIALAANGLILVIEKVIKG